MAAGDLRPKPFLQGKDELDGLTRSFAEMTQQLFEARNSVEQSMAQLDLARSHLQTMLDNLTADATWGCCKSKPRGTEDA